MIYIGNIVNTHGIKGELRIKSNFQYKDKVFKVNNKLIIDKEEYIIKSYRKHKDFDMVTLNDYKNINEVLFLLKKKVYFKEENLTLSQEEVLDSDLETYKIIDDNFGELEFIELFYASPKNKIIRTNKCLIPYNSPIIKKIDKKNKTIYVDVGDLV